MLKTNPVLRTALFCLPLVWLLASCADEEPVAPDTDVREKFLGAWTVSEEVAGAATGSYPASVTLDSANTSRIRISNIYNLGNAQSILATVAGNSLDISTQTVSGITIGGSGSFVASSFVLNYTANDGSQTESVKATYSR